MADRVSFDTSFLIDFQRERAQGDGGPAQRFLRSNESARLCLSVVALGEFAEGFADPEHDLVRLLRTTHELLVIDELVGLAYARIARRLRALGQLIGGNDLCDLCTSGSRRLRCVTRSLS